MFKKIIRFFLLFFLFLYGCQVLLSYLEERSLVSGLTMTANESDAFRRQQLTDGLISQLWQKEISAEKLPSLLAAAMAEGNFSPKEFSHREALYEKYKPREFAALTESYAAVWQDIVCFPLSSPEVSYGDTWMEERSFGGSRSHEGCDLFIEDAVSGEYPVRSMTDGVVEKVGWLPLGGYRLGIRSPHGGYFYYAHLSGYWKDYKAGDKILAGDVIGFMGDTGYGSEGTAGKFPVHLHLGIYISTIHYDELSVNPYWVLRFAEGKQRSFSPA